MSFRSLSEPGDPAYSFAACRSSPLTQSPSLTSYAALAFFDQLPRLKLIGRWRLPKEYGSLSFNATRLLPLLFLEPAEVSSIKCQGNTIGLDEREVRDLNPGQFAYGVKCQIRTDDNLANITPHVFLRDS